MIESVKTKSSRKIIISLLKPFFVFITSIAIATSYAIESSSLTQCSNDRNANEFTILSYHEISNDNEALDPTYSVTPIHFEQQIHWLLKNGYHFISIDDILNHRKNATPLPNKAVLLTFDDGYQSFYSYAYPILEKQKIPAVVALVGSWLQAKDNVDFSGPIIPRNKFLTQEELNNMTRSGLVEIASHSYLLHKGIAGNPQQNSEPAATTRQWFPDKQTYEDEKSYQQRIYNDLLKNNLFLEKYTGKKPRIIVWPYGNYNRTVSNIAKQLGMPIGLTLDDGSNTRITPLSRLRRVLVDHDMALNDLNHEMMSRNANLTDDGRTTKAAHIDLDYIYDPDPTQLEKNVSSLLTRLEKLGVNTVFLQAFVDTDGNGAADSVYFPNRNLPMRADLFNRVAWEIATQTPVKRIYAWMPMLAWQLPQQHSAAKDSVVTLQVDPHHLNMGYPRLSPFSDKARTVIQQIYEDLSKSAYIDGILFHDDVTLSDFEDDSEFARHQYDAWGLPHTVAKIRENKTLFQKWTRLKTNYLDQFAMQLAKTIRREHPELKTARNLYAQVALNNNAEEWYAQSLAQSIKQYDYTAIMAMPYMEQATDSKTFYHQIVNQIKDQPCGLERTIIELQTVNWRKDHEPISSEVLSKTIDYLHSLGINHIAYYPDNMFSNNPDTDVIKNAFNKKPLPAHLVTSNQTQSNQ